MARRMFEVVAEKPDPKNPGRTIDVPVGVAFDSDKSTTFRLRLDALPLGTWWDGSLVVHTDEPVSVIDDESPARNK